MGTAVSFSKVVSMANLHHLGAEVIRRARSFSRDRSGARYWGDLQAWAEQDHGDMPAWDNYEPALWEEILVLCEGLGEMAAIDPQLLFPPPDPWESGYGFNP